MEKMRQEFPRFERASTSNRGPAPAHEAESQASEARQPALQTYNVGSDRSSTSNRGRVPAHGAEPQISEARQSALRTYNVGFDETIMTEVPLTMIAVARMVGLWVHNTKRDLDHNRLIQQCPGMHAAISAFADASQGLP